jgi:hypothetical protein
VSGRDLDQMPAAAALRHPTRIRILEVVNERDMSPIQFLNLGVDPQLSAGSLSHVSYHFRRLEEYGCLEVVETISRRGAVEHIYRGKARTFFDDDQWEAVTEGEQRPLARAVYQGLAARVEGALLSDTFSSRPDFHLTWVQFDLDQRGWSEAMATLADSYWTIERLRDEARSRLAETDEPRIPVTIGILGFESSPAGAVRLEEQSR